MYQSNSLTIIGKLFHWYTDILIHCIKWVEKLPLREWVLSRLSGTVWKKTCIH